MKDLSYFTNLKRMFFLIILIVVIPLNAISQTKITSTEKYKQVGLIWGLLKYHHPEISKGKYNWDLEFIKLFDMADKIENREDLNSLLLSFVETYELKNKNKKHKIKIKSKKIFLKNSDYSWINPSIFGVPLTKSLLKIKDNNFQSDYYASVNKFNKMMSFENEKGLKNFNYLTNSHRLLLLYSFWNAIQYWNVNKYLIDENWVDCLDSMTEEFLNANSKLQFELVKSKLISKLNDSHAYYCSPIVADTLYKYKPVFGSKIVNDSIVILEKYNKKLAERDGIELGDIIVKIQNNDIHSYLNSKLSNLLSTSNSSYLKKWGYWLFYNAIDSINVDVISKKGIEKNKYIHLYKKFDFNNYESIPFQKRSYFTLIKPDIAYINLDQITEKEFKDVFKQINSTKGLILDLRNYPKNISNSDIAEYLYPEKKEFIKVLFPIENSPSIGEYDGEAPLQVFTNPFIVGKKNSNYYKGKVVLLVNKTTVSKAEYIGMTIQQAPNCITIGEQTAGAVMNIVSFTMSDNTVVNFTGLGAFYPNGEGVQRQGLHIDYLIKESAKNYDTDLYIKEAIKIIEE